MKAQIPDNEKRLREKILAHRVPFEEQAWDALDALLDGEKGKNAPAEQPAPQATSTRSFKYRRFFILIFLFSAVAVFSAKLGLNLLENARAKATSSSPANHLKNEKHDDGVSSGLTSESTVSENSVEIPTTSSDVKFAENNTANKSNTTAASTQNGQKTNTSKSRSGRTTPSAPKRVTNPDQGWAYGKAKQKSTSTGLNAGQSSNVANNAPTDNKDVLPEVPPTQAIAENNISDQPGNATPTAPFKTLGNLDFLPLLPFDSLNKTRELAKAEIIPVKNKTRRNWQHGWLLGANVGLVDYQPFYINVMPVAGYHVSFPVQKGYLQTGLQVTATRGHSQQAQFEWSAPGGSLEIDATLNNLLFLEVPLVYQRAFSTNKRQFWLAGIRTAWVIPINNYASYSSAGNGSLYPNAQTDLRDGIRWFDLGLTIGWQWRFSERWAMDTRYTQGLLDVTHDNFFSSTETTLNSDIQLTLRYYVSPFKKNQ